MGESPGWKEHLECQGDKLRHKTMGSPKAPLHKGFDEIAKAEDGDRWSKRCSHVQYVSSASQFTFVQFHL